MKVDYFSPLFEKILTNGKLCYKSFYYSWYDLNGVLYVLDNWDIEYYNGENIPLF